ncbi:MAG: recombinase family protein [Spirochaetes bacterium]|nr:recombinase family protein [Spirochaetota bacterium]
MSSLGYLKITKDDALNESRFTAVVDYAESHGFGPVEFVESADRGPSGSLDFGGRRWQPVRLDWIIEEKCRPGDRLIVPGFTTIARSIQQIHQVLQAMKGRNTSLHIVDRGIVVDPKEAEGPTRLSLGSAALFADFEREIIMVSMKEALKAKLEKGPKRRAPGPAR